MQDGRKGKSNFTSRILPLVFIVAFVASCPITWQFASDRFLTNIEGPTPDWFPVLAVTGEDIVVVSFSEIQNFSRTNPDYSFLIPQGKEDFYNQKLAERSRSKRIASLPIFTVEQISAEEQLINLSLYGDDRDTFVWYDAWDKQVVGKRYKTYFGPFFMMFPAFYSLIVALVMSGAVCVGWRIYKSTR